MSHRRALIVATLLSLSVALFTATAEAAAPKTPTNLRITASTGNSVSLAWNASSGGSSNWWYNVVCGGTFRVNPPQTTFTRSNIWPGNTVTCYVYAVNGNGQRSGNSNSVTYTAAPDTTPPTAPVLTANIVTPLRVKLSWTKSTDSQSPQVWYTLLKDGVPIYPTDGINTQFSLVMGLSPSTTYSFVVRVRDYFHNTVTSNTVVVTTPPADDTSPPTAPGNFRGFDGGGGEFWNQWDASIDNIDTSMILYNIYEDGVIVDFNVGTTNSITYASSAGLHTYWVVAVDTSGNESPPSNSVMMDMSHPS